MKKLFPALAILALLSCNNKPNIATTMNDYKKTDIKDLRESPAKLIGDNWMLITAGCADKFNTMTASWGTLGHLWNKNVAIVFVRPQRYTFEFMERGEHFTLSFFRENYRDALSILGSKSGRDGDKVKEVGFTPLETPVGAMAFGEAYMIIECKKIYSDFFDPELFIDPAIAEKNYPRHDFHKMYIGEIINVWKR
jgi:flavin reductase (DIM6/NTAB) family NADH-FMN oxidoreductase RutF